MIEPGSQIKVYSDLVVFHQSGIPHKFHANHGLKIIIAEEQFSVIHDHKVINSNGLIIRPDTSHKINAGPWIIISIYIDPETQIGREINYLLNKRKVLKLEKTIVTTLLNYFNDALEFHYTEREVKRFLITTLLNRYSLDTASIDERIENVIAYIRSASHYRVRFSDLLQLCSLSESRLLHLFKKEVGITIRKYVLWCKIQKAVKAIASNKTIRQAAKEAGFTDASHLNRTFVTMFGFNPSILQK